MLTTDTVDKQAARTRHGWTVGGFAKGAGMMAPSLATMLVVVTTDAVVDAATADAALRAATSTTFDRLDIDGATSTNDTVLLLASGASGVEADAAERSPRCSPRSATSSRRGCRPTPRASPSGSPSP